MARKDCDKQRSGQGAGRRQHWPVTAGCLLALCCAGTLEAQTVRVRPEMLVDHDQIRLADLAVLEGFASEQIESLQNVVIGPAPQFGQNQSVTMQQVRDALVAAGVNLAEARLTGASTCVVHRPLAMPASNLQDSTRAVASAQSSGRTLRAQIIRFLEDMLKDYGRKLDVDFGRTPKELLELSGPQYAFQIESSQRRMLGPVELRVSISHSEGPPQTEKVFLTVSLRKGVVVAASAIGRGQTVAQADVVVEERDFKKLEDIGLTDTLGVIGQEARRPIRVGEMIRTDDIKSKMLVKRNDLVRIRSLTGGIELAASATALQPGALGDIIEVLNSASSKTFWAKVTGLRQATILDEPHDRLSTIQSPGEPR